MIKKQLIILILILSFILCANLFGNNIPEIITEKYIEKFFYNRPAEIIIDENKYGLNGNKFYVSALKGNDQNSGTEDKPFKTIQEAVNICKPGDIIYVMEGTYSNQGDSDAVLLMNKHGKPKNWILIRNYPGHNPHIKFTGWTGISLQGSSYIIVSGFIISGNTDGISYKYAYANRKKAFNPKTSGSGIAIMHVWNDYKKYTHHIIIANNIVYNCPSAGIFSVNADYLQFLNNITYRNSFWSPNATSGISMYQNQPFDDSTDIKMIISGNVCYANENKISFIHVGTITDGNGIIIDDTMHSQQWNEYSTPDRYMGKTLVENNLCFNNGGKGITIYKSEFVIVRNNTCYFNSRSNKIEGSEFNAANSNDIKFENNLGIASKKWDNIAFSVFEVSKISSYHNFFNGKTDPPGVGKNGIKNNDPLFINPDINNPADADFNIKENSPAEGFGIKF